MHDHPHATDSVLDQTDHALLIFTVSDAELEKAAGGATWPYPGTGVATICAPDSPFPKKLNGQMTHAL